MKFKFSDIPLAGLLFFIMSFSSSCSSKDGKNGFERTIEGINKVGKGASEAARKTDSTLEKVSKKATEVTEHIESYSQDSAKK